MPEHDLVMQPKNKRIWLSRGVAAGVGLALVAALVAAIWPSGSVQVAIMDSDALARPVGETGRTIPVALQNRTWSRIRLVGTNAC